MGNYSIKDLENLSGIKAHTIRIWEQRYNIINPKRTDTNIRYYDDCDLKHILNISLLNDHGYKISHIARMTPETMREEVLKLTTVPCNFTDQIQSLTISMVDLDEQRFEKIMATNLLHHGFETTMLQIVYPFLLRIGILWQTGAINPAHEHFITYLIRQKLVVAIDGLVFERKPHTKKVFLFLPEGELHELGLLFAHYLFKKNYHQAIYFGQSVPLADIQEAYKIHKPASLFTIITSVPSMEEVQIYVNKLGESFPDARLLISGWQVVSQPIKTTPNIVVLKKIEDLVPIMLE